MKLRIPSIKTFLSGSAFTTGVATPSAICHRTALERDSFRAKLEVKEIEESSLSNKNEEINKNLKSNIEMVEEYERKLQRNQEAIGNLIEASKARDEKYRQTIELLHRQNRDLLEVLKLVPNIKGLLKFVADKCQYGRCDHKPENSKVNSSFE